MPTFRVVHRDATPSIARFGPEPLSLPPGRGPAVPLPRAAAAPQPPPPPDPSAAAAAAAAAIYSYAPGANESVFAVVARNGDGDQSGYAQNDPPTPRRRRGAGWPSNNSGIASLSDAGAVAGISGARLDHQPTTQRAEFLQAGALCGNSSQSSMPTMGGIHPTSQYHHQASGLPPRHAMGGIHPPPQHHHQATVAGAQQNRGAHTTNSLDRSWAMRRLRDGLCPIHGNRLIKHHECSQGMDGRQPVTDSFAADGVCLSCHPLPDYIPWARAQQMQREYHRQQQPPLVLPPQIAAREEQPPVLQPSQHEFVDEEQGQDEKLLPVSTKATSSSRFGDDLTAAATAAAAALSSPLADVPNSKWPATTDSATMAVDAAEVVAQVATAAETLPMTDCTPTAGRVRRSCRFAADAPTTAPSNSFSPPSLKMSAITTIDGDNSNGKVEGLTGQGRAACGRNLTSDAHAPGDYIQRERTGPDNKDENPYQGRTVVVIHGQHRGQQGRILCFDDNGTCRLQIENPETAVRAIIDVECDHCRLLDVVNSDLLDKYRKKAGCEIGIDELGEDELIRRALELSKKTWEEECVARGKNSRAVMSVSCFATDGRGAGKEPKNDVQSQKAANKSMKKPTPSTSWGALSSLPPSSSLISAGRRFVRRRGSACRSNSQGRIEILSDHPIKKRHWTKGKVQADDDGDTQSSSSRNETEIERKSSRKSSFSESARKNTDDNNVSAIATDTTRRSRPLRSCISSEDPEKKRRRPGAPQKLRNVKSVTFCTTSIGEQAAKRRTSPRFFKCSKTSSKGISLQNKKDLRQVDDAADIDVPPIEVDSRDNTETDDKDQSSQQDARPEKRPQKKSKLNPAPAPDHPKSNNDAGRGGGDDGNDDDGNDNDDGESSSSSDESENELEDELEELGHTLEEIKAMEQNICSAIDSASSGNVNSKKLAVQKRFVKFLRNKAKEKGPALLITRHSGVDSIVAAIRSFPTSLELLIDSFATLSDICYYNKGTYRLDLEIYPDILKIMKRYSKAKASSNAKLHFHAICTMQHLGIKRSLKHKMIADGCVEQVVESMRLYKSNVDVQDAACLCIQDLAREPQSFEDVETVLNSGAVNCILAAMLRYKTNNKLIDGALAALANIHFDERIQDERKRKLLIDHGLLAILCKTIQSDDACIVFHTFNFLNNITTEALQIDEAIIEAGLITKTAEAMHRFRNDGRVLRCACLFLGNIGHGSEGRPDQIARHGGSMAVIDCLMSFPYCSGVVQEALAALRNIGHPEEHKALDTVSLVVAVMGFHKDDAVIHNHACCILLQYVEIPEVAIVLRGSAAQEALKDAVLSFPEKCQGFVEEIQSSLAKRMCFMSSSDTEWSPSDNDGDNRDNNDSGQ